MNDQSELDPSVGTLTEARVEGRLASFALASVLGLAVLGEGGATPSALFALHAAIAVLLVAEGFSRRGGSATGPAPALVAAFACFAAWVAAGAVHAPYRFGAWLVVLEVAAFGSVGWLAARRGPGLLRVLSVLLPGFAALEGLLAVGQRVFLGESRPAGTFLNPNHLAAWFVAALCLTAAPALDGATVRRWGLRAALAVPTVAGLFLTASRGALLGVLAAVATGVLVSPSQSVPARRRALTAGLGIAALACLLGVAWRFRAGEHLSMQRTEIWRAGYSAFAARPWWGTGPGQFPSAAANLNFPLTDGPLRYERYFDSTHSDWLRSAAEFGWPAAISVLAIVLLGLGHILRTRREQTVFPVAAIAAIAALAAQALVDDLTDRPALYLLVAALIGAIIAVPVKAGPGHSAVARGAMVLAASLVVLVGDGAPWLAWRQVQGLERGRLAADGRLRLAAALRLNPLHPDHWLRRAEDIAGDGTDWSADGYAEARNAAERASALDPTNARYWRGVARVEALACRTLFGDVATRERAASAYERALECSRHDPFLPLEQARFLLGLGDPAGARRAVERSLLIEPQSVSARITLAATLAASDREEDATRGRVVLEETRQVARRWASWPRQTPYARAVLDLEPVWESAVAKRLDARPSPVDSGGRFP